jgi:hypothetical protein
MMGVLIFAGTASARGCFPSPLFHGPENRAGFIEAVIGSLGELKEVRDTMAGLQKAKDAQEFFVLIDEANESLGCSSRYQEGYKKSKNEAVSLASTSLWNMSVDLLLMNNIVRKNMIEELNGNGKAEKPGDKAARMADIGSSYRKIWGRLHISVASAILGLYEVNPRTNKMERLAITSAERNEINRQLTNEFPQIKSKKLDSLQSVESSAYLLYQVINDKKWLLHDQPFPVH